jgi:transcriptional regulator with XRE-family HTH domain
MPAKPLDPVDVYVGGRVRMRRIEVAMSQQALGQQIDLTFQQIQKYEKGLNRIGASRLQQISRILEVPAAYFVEGAPGAWQPAGIGEDRTLSIFLEVLGTRDGQSLVAAFSRISDSKLRRSVVDIDERLTLPGNSDPVTSKQRSVGAQSLVPAN